MSKFKVYSVYNGRFYTQQQAAKNHLESLHDDIMEPFDVVLKIDHDQEVKKLKLEIEMLRKQRNASIYAEVEHYESEEVGRVGAYMSKLDEEITTALSKLDKGG